MHIGIFTSGGDCPGLNAALVGAIRAAHAGNHRITGLKNGFYKFIIPPFEGEAFQSYSALQLHDLFFRGGTILGGVTKGDPYSFPMPDGSKQNVVDVLRKNLNAEGIDGLIVIGGDGSFRITSRVSRDLGIPFVCIPKTIDNDVWGTDSALGFATAVETASAMIRKLHTTAASHNRIFVVELMGRDAGFLTLHAGLAGAAHVILVPEFAYDPDEVLRRVRAAYDVNGYAIVAVSEAVRSYEGHKSIQTDASGYKRYAGVAQSFCEWFEQSLGIDTRPTVLGHIQRGGEPCAFDRLLGLQAGAEAVKALEGRLSEIVLSWQSSRMVSLPLAQVVANQRALTADDPTIQAALQMGFYLGKVA